MSEKKEKLPYYTTTNIDATGALYRFVLGERSNGKTTGVLYTCVKHCWETGKQMAYIRRWFDDLRGQRGDQVFANLVDNGMIEEITGGEWTNVYREASRWYFCRYDEDGARVTDEEPFCFGFAINNDEHDKGAGYPKINRIFFDEVVARRSYIYEEFVAYMNLLSTIIRLKSDVIIYMVGNSISRFCPYFDEMGLKHVKSMKKGEIELYTYNNAETTVAVEFSDFPSKKKLSNKYFAFDNPKLNMITGTGSVWELAIYPHCPTKYRPKDVRLTYFIEFDGELFEANLVSVDRKIFTFIHEKTTPIKDSKALLFSPRWDGSIYHRQLINKPADDVGRVIWSHFINRQVCYSTNSVGDIITNYIEWCKNAGV